MDLIADMLLAAGAFGAGLYCYVLSRRLQRFQTLEGGLGGAIAVLSAQVDDMTRALDRARGAAEVQSGSLTALVLRGETAAARLELLVASLHDIETASAVPDASPMPDPPETDGSERRLRVFRRRLARQTAEAAE
ncbi:MAG TPA: hypothetical protein PKD10_15890 [Paracoccaceae bacterium]|nr:hypothetical protein [Paracoccaceae bacterium]HMO72962.1 hypothetical protein [Paracoccaceae bacterium]